MNGPSEPVGVEDESLSMRGKKAWTPFQPAALRKRLFLLWRKALFFATPRSRRVAFKLDRDGRHITFLLASLSELGMAVQAVGTPVVFREIMSLRPSARLPFLYVSEGDDLQADILITDNPVSAQSSRAKRTILLDHHFFDKTKPGLRLPYFMPPRVYHDGWHRVPPPSATAQRAVRLGFFGTHNPDYYTRHFHFPILPRTPVLDRFLGIFADRIKTVSGSPATWGRAEIAVALDHSGGDQVRKVYLSRRDYLDGLEQCDFLLCPPGWCMPLSHNLIEGMARGVIPLLNYPDFLTPPLQDGVNCLAFATLDELERQIRQILVMPPETIRRMRQAVLDYYRTVLAPGVWLGEVLHRHERETTVLVNNEEFSISLRDPGFATAAASFLK